MNDPGGDFDADGDSHGRSWGGGVGWGNSEESQSTGYDWDHFGRNMNIDQAKRIILDECMKPGGFAISIRENQVDEEGFRRLLEAIGVVAREVRSEQMVDRLTIGCLFELPWEIENTIKHYNGQSVELGSKVSSMADQLREALHELLWDGLDAPYER